MLRAVPDVEKSYSIIRRKSLDPFGIIGNGSKANETAAKHAMPSLEIGRFSMVISGFGQFPSKKINVFSI